MADGPKIEKAQPDWYEDGLRHLWLPYSQMKTVKPPIAVKETRGSHIHLADGRRLIDGIASWWTAVHGYNHPHILDAIKRQATVMPHIMLGGMIHEPAARLAARLAHLLPGDLNHVFFAESGSVSVEVAMKMALQYWLNRGERRPRFLFFRHGYHGDTLGTMAVCDPDEGMHSHFRGMLHDHVMADLPRGEEEMSALERLLQSQAGEIAGIIMEPLVQGAGGMRFHRPAVLKAVAEIARRHDTLFILDEIFTGFGRTGTMFACEQAAIAPDIMTLSKALTGGTMPLSAAIASTQVFDSFYADEPEKALMHGPTFMAHALGCAAANASLDLFEAEDRLGDAKRISQFMKDALLACKALPSVRDVRVLGAIGVVELDKAPDIEALRAAFIDKGLWIRPLGNVVYLTPALTIAEADLIRLCEGIYQVLARL